MLPGGAVWRSVTAMVGVSPVAIILVLIRKLARRQETYGLGKSVQRHIDNSASARTYDYIFHERGEEGGSRHLEPVVSRRDAGNLERSRLTGKGDDRLKSSHSEDFNQRAQLRSSIRALHYA